MYTRLTAVGCHDERDWCTRTATAVLASEVSATSPSIPAVLRPVLRCVTCRTLTSVFDRLRSISFCRFLTFGQSPSCDALKIRCRSRRTFSSWARQSTASHHGCWPSSSGPFTPRAAIATAKVKAVIASNLPFGSSGLSCLASTTHLLTSARFRARAPGPVSGQLCETASGGAGPGVLTGCLVFLLPFGCRHSLVEHPVPPRDSAPLTIGLPHRHRQRGPDGVSTFRTHQTRLGPGALCTPGTAAPTRPGTIPGRRLPPSNGRSLSPRRRVPPRDVQLTRHQQEFTGVHPTPSLPLACGPRTDQGPLGFPVSFAPASPGDRHARHGGDGS